MFTWTKTHWILGCRNGKDPMNYQACSLPLNILYQPSKYQMRAHFPLFDLELDLASTSTSTVSYIIQKQTRFCSCFFFFSFFLFFFKFKLMGKGKKSRGSESDASPHGASPSPVTKGRKRTPALEVGLPRRYTLDTLLLSISTGGSRRIV